MADERDEALRAMALHRGLKLRKSRRRKAGGDFGLYGLVDAGGKAVLGIGEKGLEATGDEVESWLRDAARSTWKSSAGAIKARKELPEPQPEPEPESEPKPEPEPKPLAVPEPKLQPKPKAKPPPKSKPKLAVDNLFAKLPAAKRAEAFTALFDRPGVRIERIVSHGQATPEDEPMVQEQDEWVVLLKGEAGIRVEESAEAILRPGDHLMIPGGKRHWVTYTAKDEPTVWLAVHIG